MKNNRFLYFILLRYSWRLFVVFILNLFSVLLSILVFLLIEPFSKLLFRGSIDSLSPISAQFVSIMSQFFDLSSLSSSVVALIVFALVLFFLKDFFAYFSQWVMAKLRSDLLFYLRNELYKKIITLPLSYFNRQKRGDVVARAVNDTQEIQNTILVSLKTFMTEPITLIFFLLALFLINVRLSIYSLLLLPISFLIIAWISSTLRKHSRLSKQRLGSLMSHLEESLGGLRIIKGFNSQFNARNVFRRLNDQYADSQTRIYRLVDLSSPVSEFLGVTSVMMVLLIGGTMVMSNTSNLSPEMFITYIALFSQIINPLKNISTAFSNYKRGQAALDRYFEIMSAEDNIIEDVSPLAVSEIHDSLDLTDLSFAYEQNIVLSHIDIHIPKGKTIAIVGQSGAGKSTIIDLLERFYDPTSGAILLDGVDVRRLDLSKYRSLFSLVSQDVVLFNDTIYNNVTMGLTGVSEEEVWNALRVANIYDFVSGLADGLSYYVGDRGVNLSGGQRQRISIARAVLRNSQVLLLDEATSAMDTESERLVQEAVDRVVEGRTVVVIAHRLSTIQKADQIYLLDKGRVVEHGTHTQLIEKRSSYYKLVQIQQFS